MKDFQTVIPFATGEKGPGRDGGIQPVLQDQFGALIVQQGGKYSRAAQQGRLFGVANQAAVATTAALATAYTGLVVGNPATSKVKLSLLQAGFVLTVAGSKAGAIGLMFGTQITTSPLIPRNVKTTGPQSQALANAGQTIGTPVLGRVLGSFGTLATSSWSIIPACQVDLDGAEVVERGGFVAFYTTLDTTASFIFSLIWEEIPT